VDAAAAAAAFATNIERERERERKSDVYVISCRRRHKANKNGKKSERTPGEKRIIKDNAREEKKERKK
jgi:hypothetical protein